MTTAKTNLFDKPNGGKAEDAAPELTNKGICEILLDSRLKKGFVIFSAIAAIFFALYSFRLGFADTLAEKADSAEIAQLVVGLDPNNPNARRVYARFLSEKFTAEDD
ncbi:MAG TPA: hypothetical protein VNK26_07190, partial [Pyrinomonadaceae bacterium]|nr:hypothetical protein [Pyrinomonadaceae bacterium]